MRPREDKEPLSRLSWWGFRPVKTALTSADMLWTNTFLSNLGELKQNRDLIQFFIVFASFTSKEWMKRKFAKLIILHTKAYFSFPKLKAKLYNWIFSSQWLFSCFEFITFLNWYVQHSLDCNPYLKFLSNKLHLSSVTSNAISSRKSFFSKASTSSLISVVPLHLM